MNRQQLQKLITAGVFSAALMAGTSYAADPATSGEAPKVVKPSRIRRHKKAAMSVQKSTTSVGKSAATHACAGQNGCKGQGGCKTGDGGCAGKNSCAGKGGCASDGSAMH